MALEAFQLTVSESQRSWQSGARLTDTLHDLPGASTPIQSCEVENRLVQVVTEKILTSAPFAVFFLFLSVTFLVFG